jgi:hypothetical protein
MKERKGPFGQMVGGIVDTVVQGARRRAQDREPRVLLYDENGHPQLVPQDAPAREAMIAAAGELIDLVGGAPPEAETETETGVAAEDLAAVSAVEADPDEVGDVEVVTDAEIVETDDAIATADDEVATVDETVRDADVVAPEPEPDDDRP